MKKEKRELALNREIYYILFTDYENMNSLSCELESLRKNYFTRNKTRQTIKNSNKDSGYLVTVKSTVAQNMFKHKKTSNRLSIEESFESENGYNVTKNNSNGDLYSKIYYSSEFEWNKTEYFTVSNSIKPVCILQYKSGAIELCLINNEQKTTSTNLYYPVPYDIEKKEGFLDKFEKSKLFVSSKDGTFSLRLKKEQEEILSWNENTTKTNKLDAILYTEQEVKKVDIKKNTVKTATNTNDKDLEFVRRIELEAENDGDQELCNYTGKLISGKPIGIGRTEQDNGLTIYDGTFKNGKKDGFGTKYKNNGEITFAGFWKQDKKDGAGISFNDDKSTHITKWIDGHPGDHMAIFDKNANLNFLGSIIDGKKNGVGMSYLEDKQVFLISNYNADKTKTATMIDKSGNLVYIGGYENGKKNGFGTEFDTDGEIIYKGQFKDDEYTEGMIYKRIVK